MNDYDEFHAWFHDLKARQSRAHADRMARKAVRPVPDRKTVVDGLLRGMAELDAARLAA